MNSRVRPQLDSRSGRRGRILLNSRYSRLSCARLSREGSELLWSDMVGVAIGLALVFFVFASVASGIVELAAQNRRKRARLLRRGILRILGDNEFAEVGQESGTAKAFFEHPLVRPMFWRIWSNKKRLLWRASYMPASLFSTVLLDITIGNRRDIKTEANLLTACDENCVSASVKKVLRATYRATEKESGKDGPAFTKGIENWFDSVMDRASGAYKRWSRWMLFATGLVLAVGVNVDTIAIARTLSQSSAVREAAVKMANDMAAESTPTAQVSVSVTTGEATAPPPTPTPSQVVPSSSPTQTPSATTRSDQSKLTESIGRVFQLGQIGIPIGWPLGPSKCFESERSVFVNPDGISATTQGDDHAFAAVARSSSEVDLKWKDVWDDETGFAVERATSGGSGPFVTIAVLNKNRETYVDKGLAPSTTYWYRLRVFTKAGDTKTCKSDVADPRVPKDLPGWLFKVLGWLITAVAISFGAPYWFDVLSKLTPLRSAGKAPGEGERANGKGNGGSATS